MDAAGQGPGATPAMEPVDRVVLAGEASRPDVHYADLERLREEFARRHEGDGVHGALVFQSGWIVLWLEGPAATLRDTLRRIQDDPRAHSHRVLHHSRGPRYLLTRWSMMMIPSGEPAAAFRHRVDALFERRQRGVQFPPTSVVRRLCAPLRVRGPARADEAESFHRVGVCSADDGRAFEFVGWLARLGAGGPYRRRVAGEQDHDSASDYAEFLADGWPCRVIAVSRAGLQHGFRRAFLPDWPFLLLLFGVHAGRNGALMDRVVEACAGLPQVPCLLAVGPDAHMHARMAQQARHAALQYDVLGLYEAHEHEEIWGQVAARLRQVGAPPSSQWDSTQPSWVG